MEKIYTHYSRIVDVVDGRSSRSYFIIIIIIICTTFNW